jgi:hypothetical protein
LTLRLLLLMVLNMVVMMVDLLTRARRWSHRHRGVWWTGEDSL